MSRGRHQSAYIWILHTNAYKKNPQKQVSHCRNSTSLFWRGIKNHIFKKKILTWSIFQESKKGLSASSASFSFHKLLSAAFREDYSRSSWRIALQCQSLIIKTGTKETWRKGDNLHFSVGNFMGLVCVKCSKILVLRESKALSKKNTSPRPANSWATAAAENQWHTGDFNNEKLRSWKKGSIASMLQEENSISERPKSFPKAHSKIINWPFSPGCIHQS